MRIAVRFFKLLVCLSLAIRVTAGSPLSYQQTKDTPTGSISGKVMLDGQPAIAIKVSLGLKSDPDLSGRVEGSTRWVTTNAEGHYTFDALAAGSYDIIPHAPALIPEATRAANPRSHLSSMITLRSGESVDGIDFALKRGGAITGKITDVNGVPLVGQSVTAIRIKDDGSPAFSASRHSGGVTDDRGIYRLYGIEPGKYRVVCRLNTWGQGQHLTPVTYYPRTPDESAASLVNVEAGNEARGIDFQVLSQLKKTYRATGAVIDAETGKAIPNFGFSYGMRNQDGSLASSGDADTDDAGFFLLDGLQPGNYALFGHSQEQELEENRGYYLDMIPFDVVDGPVSGLAVKAQRGSSIDGLVTIEGTADPAAIQNLGQLWLQATAATNGSGQIESRRARVAADGSFHFAGVAPGTTRIALFETRETAMFRLLKVTRDGVAQDSGVQVSAGENIQDIQVAVLSCRGTINGELQVQGGKLEIGESISVLARSASNPLDHVYVTTDARGTFTMRNVPDGDYSFAVYITGKRTPPVEQTVTVADGAEVHVTLVLDFSKVPPPKPN